METKKTGFLSETAYLEQERNAEVKSEYFAGETFAMADASERHNLLVANLIFQFKLAFQGGPCRAYPSDMRLKIEESGLYTYPDVMVLCGETRFADGEGDTLLNPLLIAEALSDSTERYDRGVRFGHYRKIPSLREYLLVFQNFPKIERYFRNTSGNWELRETDDAHPALALEAVDVSLPLDAVYDGIAFDPSPSGRRPSHASAHVPNRPVSSRPVPR
ncbi:MAG: Uma2 family endonuclease [Desulfococcaceae bacterium]